MSLCDWGCTEGQTAHLMEKRLPASVVTGVDVATHAVLKAKELSHAHNSNEIKLL